MSLGDALKVFKSHAVPIEEVVEAVAWPANTNGKIFIARPLFRSSDAFRLEAVAVGDDTEFKIRSLRWHIEYEDDRNLPYMYRANRILDLESINVKFFLPNTKAAGVKRGRSETNPFE